LTRQAHDPAGAGDEADANLRQRELCSFVRNDQVASQRDLETTPEGKAVDRGDDGFVAHRAAGQAAKAGFGHP
jgi:hypothetical protein